MMPTGPEPFLQVEDPDDALTLAVDYNVYPVRTAILSSLLFI